MGARSRRVERLAGLFPEVAALFAYRDERDSSWMVRCEPGDHAWFRVPLPVSLHAGMSDEDELIAESNFEVALSRLEAVASFSDSVGVRYDSWPGGLIRSLEVRVDDPAVVRVAAGVVGALAEFPILDEVDHRGREVAAAWSWWEDYVASEVADLLTDEHDIPWELANGYDWHGRLVGDVSELLLETAWWRGHKPVPEEWDVAVIAGEVAALIREEVGGQEPGRVIMRDCRVCGEHVVVALLGRCEGCRETDCRDVCECVVVSGE
jgi:hypothetical protein